jgi:hypothetical protein
MRFLTQLVAQEVPVSPSEARGRVMSVARNIQSSLDAARRAAVLAAFVAASLPIGAAAAWSASIAGGKHRDEGTLLSPSPNGLNDRARRAPMGREFCCGCLACRCR